MIVGDGLLASLFYDSDRENIIFYASGVSNSLETRREEFLKEENLIRETFSKNPYKIFIYFSTCSIYDSSKNESPYVLHKKRMEQIISDNCKKYLILRVSNAVGKGGNPNLLMNYLVRSLKNNETINIHTKATRNLIDVADIKKICLYLLDKNVQNKIVNVAYLQNYSIPEIIAIVDKTFGLKSNLNLVDSGSGYEINISSDVKDYFIENNLTDKETYLCNILKKYYL